MLLLLQELVSQKLYVKKANHQSNISTVSDVKVQLIAPCSGYSHSLDDGIRLMDKLEVAGISCKPNMPTY